VNTKLNFTDVEIRSKTKPD